MRCPRELARHPVRCGATCAFVIALGVAPSLATAQQTARAQRTLARGAAARATIAEPRVLTAARAIPSITLDGRLDDAAWSAAPSAADFVQQRPESGAGATQRTEARVLFDAGAMYVGMRMHDTGADSIAAPLARRDYDGYSDWAQVLIDSYFDRRTAFRFAVNPSGAKRDGLLAGDEEWNEDTSWDPVWDVATARDTAGWTAEFRIPLTQLRFAGCAAAASAVALRTAPTRTAGTSDGCSWGIQFIRDIARRGERSAWSPLPPDASGFVSRFGTLDGLAGVSAPRRMEILPYSLGRATRAAGRASNPFHRRNDLSGALGADMKLGLTANFTLTATLNPDFGQVEADPSEVNLTGFESFLSERRPFFVEGGDIFRFTLASASGFFGQDQIFYSRRIGRAPQGEIPDDAVESETPDATTLLGAAKLSGKTASGWSVGVLNAVTGEERGRYIAEGGARLDVPVEPLTSYTVARVVKDFERGASAIGAVFTATNRRIDDASLDVLRADAYAGGLDWRRRFGAGSWVAGGNLLASHVRGSARAITETQLGAAHRFQRTDAEHLEVDSSRTSLSGVSSELRLFKNGGAWRMGLVGRVVTPGFEVNDLGFQGRSDVGNAGGWFGYVHVTPGRRLRSWETWFNYWSQWSLAGERVYTGASQYAQMQLTNHWRMSGELRHDLPGMSVTALRGGPSLYTNARTHATLHVESDPRRLVSGALDLRGWTEHGSDGRMLSVNPSIIIRPSSRAELSLEPAMSTALDPWQYVATQTVDGTTSFVSGRLVQTTAALTTRLAYTFTPTLSFQLYAQPFLSAGRYASFLDLRAPGASRFRERFQVFPSSRVQRSNGDRLGIDRDGDGGADLDFEDPDFNVGALRSNAVLRWEYRPGSTLFVVWSQGRDTEHEQGDFVLRRDGRRLLDAAGTNVLLVKLSYWLNP